MVKPDGKTRITKIDTYLNVAEVFAFRSTCIKRKYGADLYLAGVNPEDNSVYRANPCPLCARMIIQAGIERVILRVGENAGDYEIIPAKELVWHK